MWFDIWFDTRFIIWLGFWFDLWFDLWFGSGFDICFDLWFDFWFDLWLDFWFDFWFDIWFDLWFGMSILWLIIPVIAGHILICLDTSWGHQSWKSWTMRIPFHTVTARLSQLSFPLAPRAATGTSRWPPEKTCWICWTLPRIKWSLWRYKPFVTGTSEAFDHLASESCWLLHSVWWCHIYRLLSCNESTHMMFEALVVQRRASWDVIQQVQGHS